MRHITPKATASKKRIVLAVGALVLGTLLAGCTTPNPTPTTALTHTATPTPTATPTKVAAPKTQDDAVTEGTLAFDQYLKIRAQVNAAGGTNTAPLEKVATGQALTVAKADAGRVAQGKLVTKGRLVFTVTNAYASVLTTGSTKIPYGTANLTGCQDGSGYKIYNADGTPAQQPQGNYELSVMVIYNPSTSSWMVENVVATGKKC
jgi:hypothetical protein